MAKRSPLIVGLDIGTYKISTIVAEVGEDWTPDGTGSGEIQIVGVGSAPSHGLRKGVVVNIDSTVESIRKAVAEAELMAGCEIHNVYAGIAGAHVKGFNSHGVVAVKATEVNGGDVDRVLDAARAVALPMDRQVVHVLPQEFVVDEQDGIKQPVGMAGVRLESKVHIITASVTSCWSRSRPPKRWSRRRSVSSASPSSTSAAGPPTSSCSTTERSSTPPCCRSGATT
jgi:cell division protein FtsA